MFILLKTTSLILRLISEQNKFRVGPSMIRLFFRYNLFRINMIRNSLLYMQQGMIL